MSQQQNFKSTLERAFEIAGSGRVATIEQLSHVLASEGYAVSMLMGPLLLKQLRKRIDECSTVSEPRPIPARRQSP